MTREDFEDILLFYGTTPTPDEVYDILSLVRYADLYIRAWRNLVTKTMWQEIKSYHYYIYYLTYYFVMDNYTNNHVDNSMKRYVNNFEIISMDNSKILYENNYTIPSGGNSSIPSVYNSMIPSVDSSTIYSVDNYKIPPGDNYKIPSVNNYKVITMELGSSSNSMSSAPYTIPLMVPMSLTNLNDLNIFQHIWSRIFNNKQDLK